MLLSRRCEYALRATLYLAWQPEDASLTVRAVSSTLGIPHAFLAKAMRDLAAAGIVETQPGTGGGVKLARPAREVALKEGVLAMDGPEVFEACVLGCRAAAISPRARSTRPGRGPGSGSTACSAPPRWRTWPRERTREGSGCSGAVES